MPATASRRRSAATEDQTPVPLGITPGCILPQREARRRLGMGQWAWLAFKKKTGLKTTRVGHSVFVRTDDIIAAIDRVPAAGDE